jgi:CubicO group peptidase (beta-lactamase class C family)
MDQSRMTPGPARKTSETSFEPVWEVPSAHVASGRIPGFVAALRLGGHVEVRAGGTMALDADSPPMTEDTLFRVASLTKPVGAALTLALVQDGVLALDDPIARWLPEAAKPRVLVAPDSPLDDTVEAERPATVWHLLTLTSGWGAVLERTPLQEAMLERGVYPGPLTPQMSGDEFVGRVSGLPLAFQPGEGWLYDTGIDLLGVLLVRATGKPLSELMAERVTGPLGMTSTGFWAAETHRLATAYMPGPEGLEVLDPPDGLFAAPPRFEELSSGLVSTASDMLRFFSAMAVGGAPLVNAGSLALMTGPVLNDAQRRQALPIVGPGGSWGLGTGVDVEAAEPWMSPGRWGWDGGTGTTGYVDPIRGTVGVLLTQRAMTSALDGFGDFWTAVAQAADSPNR